jgi:hypothetical protein
MHLIVLDRWQSEGSNASEQYVPLRFGTCEELERGGTMVTVDPNLETIPAPLSPLGGE